MNFNNKSLEVWEYGESPETKTENKEQRQENLDKSIKPIEQVRNECLSKIYSSVENFVKINFPKFNYKFEFNGLSRDISSEFMPKITNLLSELQKKYPGKSDILKDYELSVFGEINKLSSQLKTVTSYANLSNIVKYFEEDEKLTIGVHRTFTPSV